MRIVDRSSVQLPHDVLTHVDDPRSLLHIQCRCNMWAKKLKNQPSIRNYARREEEVKRLYLKEKCRCKTSSHEEKVWGVTHVAGRVHIIRPQVEQCKRSFHTLAGEPIRNGT
jgi:hypothetical protein